MREILFRGKRVDNREWVEGYYLYTEENTHPVIIDMKCRSHIIIPETVGQFTGLKDKNGKRIFEGDIITAEPDKSVIAAVKYNESKAAFHVENENAEDYLGEAWDTDVVVIGNVFDNNELLKGENYDDAQTEQQESQKHKVSHC